MAEPQADGYDTRETLAFAARRGYVRPTHPAAPRIFGDVALLPDPARFGPGFTTAPPDHPNLRRAEAAFRLWPAGFEQAGQLLDSVNALMMVSPVDDDDVVGCVSGPGAAGFGCVAGTATNHVGFAEAIVHEMAHHKLCALGIDPDRAERLILNPPSELYPGSIRYDRLRPMSAVLHAHYSYTYVAALDVAIVQAGREPVRDRRVAADSLAVVLPKLEFGRRVIQDHARTDADGMAFLDGLLAWLDRVLRDGFALLARHGLEPRTFGHPTTGSTARGEWPGAPAPTARPRRADGLLECDLGDELLVYTPQRNAVLALNASSRAIWARCTGAETPPEIAATLSRQFGLPGEALVADVLLAMAQFSALGLLADDKPGHS